MNINASIIDQRVSGIVEDHPEWLPEGDDNKKKSAAFVLLCMSVCLDMTLEESTELLTEGGNDAGVDGLHVGEVEDGEFLVTVFQGKYKVKDLRGEANFPENDVQKSTNTIRVLFDPYQEEVTLNEKIKPKIEEVRSLIRDGDIPNVRVILCNNGAKWTGQADMWIAEAKKDYGDKVEFVHFNHDSLVNILQRSKSVDTALTLSGEAIVEDMNYMRVLVGRVAVQEIQRLFNDHGDKLLERNIRRYLGLHTNRVNAAINKTLRDSEKSDKFYFYNNGITVVCDQFNYNAFQKKDYKVQLKNMQVINGGQTCKTIQQTLNEPRLPIFPVGESAYVMIRVYQLSDAHKELVQDITYATNSQNPVDLRDLRSNDDIQKRLDMGVSALGLGYTYKRQREEGGSGPTVITSSIVAEAVLAIWRERPHQAKFRRKEHFGKLYQDIFADLNAAQALLAVLIFREVENERKRPTTKAPPEFLPYASHYISMLVGRKLLNDQSTTFGQISHRNIRDLSQAYKDDHAQYHADAIQSLEKALKECYGAREISLQQLAATFRRGDLMEML